MFPMMGWKNNCLGLRLILKLEVGYRSASSSLTTSFVVLDRGMRRITKIVPRGNASWLLRTPGRVSLSLVITSVALKATISTPTS
mgnify:CR=1 FL=1